MRVIAATFRDDEAADRVLLELRRTYDLGVDDAQLAPLGNLGRDETPETVVAGRFEDERSESVRELVERHGGRVVMNVDEAATKRRLTRDPEHRRERETNRRRFGLPVREPNGIFY